MAKLSITFLLGTLVLAMILEHVHVQAEEENNFEQARATSNEFLRRKRGIFHPGVTACEEQKREAREDYEERCEPSIPWQRNRQDNRYCPDINNWQELDAYEIGEGGGFDLDTLSKLIPQNMSMEKIIGESDYANRFLKRTFFHPGATKCEEQKREAREDYEERCEPSFPLFRNTGTRRFCPDIHNWKALDNYEIGDGYESRDPISGDRTSISRNYDRDQFNRNDDAYNRNRDPPTSNSDASRDYDPENFE